MAEMVGEFPDLHRTIVSERDVYLTYMLRQAARRLELPRASDGEHGACRHGAPRGTGALGCSCVSHPSRAQEVRPLRGGGRRGHGPRPRHREELDHRPQHPGDHDVSAAPPHRAGLGAGTAPPPQPAQPALPPQRAPAVRLGQSVPPGREGRLPGPPGLRPLLDRAPRRQPAPGPARRPALPAEALRRLAAQVAAQTSRRVLAEGPPRRGPGPALPARPQPAQIKESVHCLSSGLPAAPPPCPSPVGC